MFQDQILFPFHNHWVGLFRQYTGRNFHSLKNKQVFFLQKNRQLQIRFFTNRIFHTRRKRILDIFFMAKFFNFLRLLNTNKQINIITDKQTNKLKNIYTWLTTKDEPVKTTYTLQI